jgi:methyl-accepting chemotaxis protein
VTQTQHQPSRPVVHKRKQFWIDAPLQLQMLAYVVVLVIASLALVTFSILRGLTSASADSKQIFHSLDWVLDAISGPLLVSSALSILAAGVLTLIWSHRFAGPLRVLSAGINRIKHGNLTVPVRIRATDTHQELAKEFQSMQEGLRKIVVKDRERLDELSKKLHELAGKHGDHKSELEHVAKELKSLGSEFQL